jgi:hypothetical protein
MMATAEPGRRWSAAARLVGTPTILQAHAAVHATEAALSFHIDAITDTSDVHSLGAEPFEFWMQTLGFGERSILPGGMPVTLGDRRALSSQTRSPLPTTRGVRNHG